MNKKFNLTYFLLFVGLLVSCNSVEIFVENKEVPFQKKYTRFVLVNKELDILGFKEELLDQQVQEALITQLVGAGLVYDAKQPDLVIRYYSNEDLRQRERVNTMNPYPFWGMRMYDPWSFNPMMRNVRSPVIRTNYELLQVILDVIDPDQDKYLMTITGVTEVTNSKNKSRIVLKTLERTVDKFIQVNLSQNN